MADAEQVFDVGFAGNCVRIRCDSARTADTVGFLFEAHLLSVACDDVRCEVGIAIDPADEYFLLFCDGRVVAKLHDDELEIALVQLVQLHLVTHEAHAGLFHGASLVFDGQGILFAAAAGSGKTTLTASLLGEGYGFLTDELTAIDGCGRMEGFARPLNIKAGSLDLLRRCDWLAPALGRARLSGGVTLMPWPRIGSADIRLDAVVLPEWRADAAFGVEALSPGRAAAALMSCLLNARNLPKSGLALATRLVCERPVHRVRYSRVDDVAAWLAAQRLAQDGALVGRAEVRNNPCP